jgi:hypothetical protein
MQNQAVGAQAATADDDEEEEPTNASHGTFDYLLSMPIYSLTHEKVCSKLCPCELDRIE